MKKESIDILFNKCIKSIMKSIELDMGETTEDGFKQIRKTILNEINDLKRIFYDSN